MCVHQDDWPAKGGNDKRSISNRISQRLSLFLFLVIHDCTIHTLPSGFKCLSRLNGQFVSPADSTAFHHRQTTLVDSWTRFGLTSTVSFSACLFFLIFFVFTTFTFYCVIIIPVARWRKRMLNGCDFKGKKKKKKKTCQRYFGGCRTSRIITQQRERP